MDRLGAGSPRLSRLFLSFERVFAEKTRETLKKSLAVPVPKLYCWSSTLVRLSLRASLAGALVVVNVGLTAVVAVFAYRAAHDVMVDQAIGSVAGVAAGRERELQGLLENKQQ